MRTAASNRYQYVLVEVPVDVDVLKQCDNSQGLYAALNPFAYSEAVLELQDRLKERLWELVAEVCTEHQQEVLRMLADGYTQHEVAKALRVNQSSITKCLNGNHDYRYTTKGKFRRYGGIIPKLRKAISRDPECQELIAAIAEHRSD
jgi:predicted DNA-binding protein YlxM (UPF0122 family)